MIVNLSDLTRRLRLLNFSDDSVLKKLASKEKLNEIAESSKRYDIEIERYRTMIRTWFMDDYKSFMPKGIIVGGPPGIGKTYTLRQVLHDLVDKGIITTTHASIDGVEDDDSNVKGLTKLINKWQQETDFDGKSDEEIEEMTTKFVNQLKLTARVPCYIKGKITPLNMARVLYFNRHPGNIVIFDDSDEVFTNEDAMNLLKSATDTTVQDDGGRLISVLSPQKNYANNNPFIGINHMLDELKIPDSFIFKGRVVCITNIRKNEMKNNVHFEAIESRMHYHCPRFSREDLYNKVITLIATSDKIKNTTVSNRLKTCILKFLLDDNNKVNVMNSRGFSLRAAEKLLSLAAFFNCDEEMLKREFEDGVDFDE